MAKNKLMATPNPTNAHPALGAHFIARDPCEWRSELLSAVLLLGPSWGPEQSCIQREDIEILVEGVRPCQEAASVHSHLSLGFLPAP